MSSIVLKDLNFIERALSEPRDLKGGMEVSVPTLPSIFSILNLEIPSSSGIDSSNAGETSSSATAQISGDKGGTAETFTFTTSNNF
jgi:hypothetical protein